MQCGQLLHDLAFLDDTLDLGDEEGADTHYTAYQMACPLV